MIPLVDNDTVKVIPIVLKKDGMALKSGMQADPRQGLIVGTTEKIDYKYRGIQENAKPDPEKLQDIFIKEAECYSATAFDRKVNLPFEVDYIKGGLDASDTCDTPSVRQKNGVLLEHQDCTSICENCIEEGTVCSECTKNLPCLLAVDVLKGIPNASRSDHCLFHGF